MLSAALVDDPRSGGPKWLDSPLIRPARLWQLRRCGPAQRYAAVSGGRDRRGPL